MREKGGEGPWFSVYPIINNWGALPLGHINVIGPTLKTSLFKTKQIQPTLVDPCQSNIWMASMQYPFHRPRILNTGQSPVRPVYRPLYTYEISKVIGRVVIGFCPFTLTHDPGPTWYPGQIAGSADPGYFLGPDNNPGYILGVKGV